MSSAMLARRDPHCVLMLCTFAYLLRARSSLERLFCTPLDQDETPFVPPYRSTQASGRGILAAGSWEARANAVELYGISDALN
jgi:hypothetical protein